MNTQYVWAILLVAALGLVVFAFRSFFCTLIAWPDPVREDWAGFVLAVLSVTGLGLVFLWIVSPPNVQPSVRRETSQTVTSSAQVGTMTSTAAPRAAAAGTVAQA